MKAADIIVIIGGIEIAAVLALAVALIARTAMYERAPMLLIEATTNREAKKSLRHRGFCAQKQWGPSE